MQLGWRAAAGLELRALAPAALAEERELLDGLPPAVVRELHEEHDHAPRAGQRRSR